jgi:YfiH family protein
MFKEFMHDGKFLGYTLETGRHFLFFGSRAVAREDLAKLFPRYDFCWLKQVHGRDVVEAQPGAAPAADAHFTAKPARALVVQTADCLPILLTGPTHVCAIHAGWRGVAQNIVAAAAEALKGRAQIDVAAIGPHIGRDSFIIGADANEPLQRACPLGAAFSQARADGKFLFDLQGAAQAQLRQAFSPTLEIRTQAPDTVTSADFHSFRRDRERAGRQFSFVVINR